MPDELLLNGDQTISFLDAKGFRYYLPAYLVWCLRYMDGEDEEFSSSAFDSVDFHLMAVKKSRIDDYRLGRFKSLNFEQSKAVVHFLRSKCEQALFSNESEDDLLHWESKIYQQALALC